MGKSRTINKEEYSMVLDWSEYKTTKTLLPCKCQGCGTTIRTNINRIDTLGGAFCKTCGNKKMGEKQTRVVNHEEYKMVIDWTGYEKTTSLLPCRCDICGDTTQKSIYLLDKSKKSCLCEKCVPIKIKEVFAEKYNVEHPMRTIEVKEKVKQTNIERRGVDNPAKCEVVIEKIKNTNLERYGHENASKSIQVKEKIKNTNQQKCIEDPTRSEKIIEKRKKTNLEKYGNEFPQLLPEIKERIKQTNKKRRGVEYPAQCEDVRKKMKQTNLERYNVEHYSQHEKFEEKCKETCQKNHGVDFPSQNEIVREKIRKTCMERYGHEHPAQSEIVREKMEKTCMERYGVPLSCMSDNVRKSSKTISRPNLKWWNLIYNNFGIECDFEFNINKKSFDLKIETLLIDINPTISHNTTISFAKIRGFTDDNDTIEKDYHFNRWKLAKDSGYTLISIFDDMDEQKMLNIIRSKIGRNQTKIAARKCEIKEIEQKEVNFFLEKYHIQGKAKGQKVCIGLFHNNELCGTMTFGKPRFNKNYEWELVRLCFKENVTIQGGISKMWKYFKNKYDPQNCICYLNLNLGGDEMYLSDFRFKRYNKPAGYWVNFENTRTITNNSLRSKGASRFIGDADLIKYPKGMDNREIMKLEGFVEIYDCGNVVYEYKKNLITQN